MSPESTTDEIIEHLRTLGADRNRQGMARYGIETSQAFGVSNAVLRPLARQIKRNQPRARTVAERLARSAPACDIHC